MVRTAKSSTSTPGILGPFPFPFPFPFPPPECYVIDVSTEGPSLALPLALQGLSPPALVLACDGALELAEARKIVSRVHRELGIGSAFAGVRRAALAHVRARGIIPSLEIVSEQASAVDPFRKIVFRGADGNLFETVRIPLEKAGRFSVCVSSQVGCALACGFCATGRLGLRRNLETWEIVEQVRAVRRTLAAGERVHGVVFQGMGEPLANIDRVLEAISVLSDPSAQAIDARNITVCTAGLPSGIRRLAQEAPRVRLGLSIGSARRAVRGTLMPIDRTHSLDEVLAAASEHARTTGHSPMWAVTLLEGVNDTEADARALAELAQKFAESTGGIRPRISVIPYNALGVPDDPYLRASDDRENAFRACMREAGVGTHKRYSGGGDVAAACGQLASAVARPDKPRKLTALQ
jgi:23S rRNA (adenine2503-C2)-methyltransferase